MKKNKKRTLKQIQNELQNVKRRDGNIIKAIRGEIDMSRKVVKSKKLYTRKEKHNSRYVA